MSRSPLLRAAPPPLLASEDDARRELAVDVARDLRQHPRQLQSKYFYDALGSHLFEAICHLPWYKITRAEHALLERWGAEIVAPFPALATLVELGCGSGGKLALLAGRLRRRGDPVLVQLVDVSATALELSARTLARLPHVSVVGHRAPYVAGLADACRQRPPRGAMLVLFLGSNIGNFHPPLADAFLADVRAVLRPGDGFLLGADLVKPEPDLLLAYGDPLGVTAAFNKNLLVRLNRELDADFDVDAFAHAPRWNAAAACMESYLVSRRAQRVRIPAAGMVVRFTEGEQIWTESSYKYTAAGIVERGAAAGLRTVRQWIEPDARFALTLFGV